MSEPAPRRANGRVVVLIFVACFVGIAVLLYPNVSALREAARRTQCKNNLKQIGLALHNYHDTYGCFPPAITYGPDGKPWHSWRLLLLPFIEANGW